METLILMVGVAGILIAFLVWKNKNRVAKRYMVSSHQCRR